jgi:hypothetical protein
VAQVEKGHAQALVLKMVDLFLAGQVPQGHHIIHKLMLALGVGEAGRKGGVRIFPFEPENSSSLLLRTFWRKTSSFS